MLPPAHPLSCPRSLARPPTAPPAAPAMPPVVLLLPPLARRLALLLADAALGRGLWVHQGLHRGAALAA